MMSNWDEFFLGMADYVSTQSKDPSTQVGCVITRPDNTLASIGYNGFPRGCDDSPDLLRDRDTKIARTVHAELNAILNAHERLDGCTAYVTHPCCAGCAGAIIQSGICEVIVRKPSAELVERWGDSIDKATEMLHEAGVFYVEREVDLIYCVDKDRVIYEARPIGDVIIVRPARRGAEHLLERLTMLDFNEKFNIFLAKFLIPDQLDDRDRYDSVY